MIDQCSRVEEEVKGYSLIPDDETVFRAMYENGMITPSQVVEEVKRRNPQLVPLDLVVEIFLEANGKVNLLWTNRSDPRDRRKADDFEVSAERMAGLAAAVRDARKHAVA